MKFVYITSAVLAVLLTVGFSILFVKKTVTDESPIVLEEYKPARVESRCADNFLEYKNDQFSFCYPDTLVLQASNSAETLLTFTSDTEELQVGIDTDKKWQIHLCNMEKDVLIASYSAVRTEFKKETAAGCGKPYRFVTLLDDGEEQLSIDLYKKQGTYGEVGYYETIEQSLQLFQHE